MSPDNEVTSVGGKLEGTPSIPGGHMKLSGFRLKTSIGPASGGRTAPQPPPDIPPPVELPEPPLELRQGPLLDRRRNPAREGVRKDFPSAARAGFSRHASTD
jgi:hypothetical protein